MVHFGWTKQKTAGKVENFSGIKSVPTSSLEKQVASWPGLGETLERFTGYTEGHSEMVGRIRSESRINLEQDAGVGLGMHASVVTPLYLSSPVLPLTFFQDSLHMGQVHNWSSQPVVL